MLLIAYGKMLPKVILDYPRYGCINVHGSLLPKYRGSAPVHWAVINGETKTGVTTMYMAEEMDAGDILLTKETPIAKTEIAAMYMTDWRKWAQIYYWKPSKNWKQVN